MCNDWLRRRGDDLMHRKARRSRDLIQSPGQARLLRLEKMKRPAGSHFKLTNAKARCLQHMQRCLKDGGALVRAASCPCLPAHAEDFCLVLACFCLHLSKRFELRIANLPQTKMRQMKMRQWLHGATNFVTHRLFSSGPRRLRPPHLNLRELLCGSPSCCSCSIPT